MIQRNNSEGQLIASFLLMFNVIEKICDLVIIEEPLRNMGNYSWSFKKNNELLLEYFDERLDIKRIFSTMEILELPKKRIPWNQRIYNSFWYLTGSREVNFNIMELIDKRHKIIHGGSGNRTKISKQKIINLFQLTIELLIGINEKYKS